MSQMFDACAALTVASKAQEIKAAGFDAVGLYYFQTSEIKQLLTSEVAKQIGVAGVYVVAVYENGYPTSAAYFSATKGEQDGAIALNRALEAGQPSSTPIYFAVDYDASEADLTAIAAYFSHVRSLLEGDAGYTAGVYGSGRVCEYLSGLGLVSHTWLSGSEGWTGYAAWKAHADIVQGRTETVLGISVDLDETNGSAGGWAPRKRGVRIPRALNEETTK